MKLVAARFDRIVLRALPVKFYSGATGFHLKLFDGFNRERQADGAAFALLNRVGNGHAFNKNIFGKALRAIDCAPAIAFRDARQ